MVALPLLRLYKRRLQKLAEKNRCMSRLASRWCQILGESSANAAAGTAVSSKKQNAGLKWVSPYYAELWRIAELRHRRLPWILDVGDVLHQALLRWAPRQKPPDRGGVLNSQQLATFSLTCRNVLLNELRGYTRRRKLEVLRTRAEPYQVPETLTHENAEFVRSALSHLNERERAVLRFGYFKQMSFAEIAVELDRIRLVPECTTDNARKIHQRAIDKLRRKVLPQHSP